MTKVVKKVCRSISLTSSKVDKEMMLSIFSAGSSGNTWRGYFE